MKTGKQMKAGFTLVELMVVAIIVAILAAVAIPMMSGNKTRAMATEAQAACGTIATAIKIAAVDGALTSSSPAVSSLPGITTADLNGTYYTSYAVSDLSTDGKAFKIVATPKSGSGAPTVTMTQTKLAAGGTQVKWSY